MNKTLFTGGICTLLFGSSLIAPYMAECHSPHTQSVNNPDAHRKKIKREEEERRQREEIVRLQREADEKRKEEAFFAQQARQNAAEKASWGSVGGR